MPRQTIAVNTRFLLKNKLEGIGRFTSETLRNMVIAHPEHDFVFLFDRPYHSDFIFAPNVKPCVVPPPARHPLLWYLWFEIALPIAFSRIKPQLFISTDGYCSLRSKVPTLMVVHDLAFVHYPQQIPHLVERYYKHFVPLYVRRADRIAAVSDYTRQDIHRLYGTPCEKIDLVYNGINEQYKPLTTNEQADIRQQYTAGCPYFLFVGAIHPRKNLANILRAFDLFKQQNSNDVKLVIAGRKAWQSTEAFTVYEAMQYKNEVLFLGHLEVGELSKITASALALTYVSFFEGFGIPIIEAFACDVPVLTANVSSMPEVAGDAALLLDPYSPQAIATAMLQIYTDKALRNKLIGNGRLQRRRFGWQLSAEKLWESAEKVLTAHKH